MALNAANAPQGSGKQFDPMESGTYPARLVQVIDLGLQPQRPYKGQEKQPAHEIMTTYEFTDEFLKDEDGNDMEDKPRHLSENFPLYHLDSEKAKSTKRYLSLDPSKKFGGDWAQLIDTPVMVTVMQNPPNTKGRIYTNITAISPMREKDAKRLPELVNKPKVFDLDAPDLDVFNSLPKFIQEKIAHNLEFEGSKLQKLIGNGPAKKEANAEEEEGGSLPDDENPY